MNSKKCTKCNTEKSLNSFHNNKGTKDGKEYHCKDCRKNEIRKPGTLFIEEGKKICTKCNIKKEFKDFSKNKKLSGGLNYQCRECAKKEYNLSSKEKEYKTEGLKHCKKCRVKKQLTEFNKALTNKDGRTGKCRSCLQIEQNERNNKKLLERGRIKWSPYTTESFKENLFEEYGDSFELIGEYNTNNLCIKHKQCGNIKCYNKFYSLNNIGCKICSKHNKSKLSTNIENFLRRKGADYKTEVSFEKCVYKGQLYFDFAIYRNNNLSMLIEADGEQHFKETTFGKLGVIQKRDEIKNQYCKNNNINLIRISYTDEENVENILENYIKEDIYKKPPRPYFNKAGVTEKISLEVKYKYLENSITLKDLKEQYNLSKPVIRKILNYYYYPKIGLELKERIELKKKFRLGHTNEKGRHPNTLNEEEIKNALEIRKKGANLKIIAKTFNMQTKFITKDFKWKEKLLDITIKEKKCKYKETGKKFNSLKQGCDFYGINYKSESFRLNKNPNKAKFEYIS